MKYRQIHLWQLVCILLLIGGGIPVSSAALPDMTGSWTPVSIDQFILNGEFLSVNDSFVSFQITKQDGRGFVGEQTYYNQSSNSTMTEVFSGVISPDGTTYIMDNEGEGISFGEIVSEHELYNTMLFPNRGPEIIDFHLVKSGAEPGPSGEIPDLKGSWNLTHTRSDSLSTTGILMIDQQEGEIWSGSEEIEDEDGTLMMMPLGGTIGPGGRIFATTQNGAFMIGTHTGDGSIQSTFIIPGDDDGTFVLERDLSKDETAVSSSELVYPKIAGLWTIENRKVIENGTITNQGPVSDEEIEIVSQTGPFFSVLIRSQEAGSPSEIPVSGIFRSPDEAYLTGADPVIVMYHIINTTTIEAMVNQKDDRASLYLDTLTLKPE